MISTGEIAAIEKAIAAARFQINSQEIALRNTQNAFSAWLFPSDERRALDVSRDMLAQAIRQRNFIVEDSEPRHEEALQIVEICNRIATPGWVYQATKSPDLIDRLSDIGKRITKNAIDNPLTNALFGPWFKIALVVVGLVALSYILSMVPRGVRNAR